MVEVLTKVVKKGDEGGRVDVMLFTYCLEGVSSYMRYIVGQYLSYDKDSWAVVLRRGFDKSFDIKIKSGRRVKRIVARGFPNGESFHWK